MLGAIIGDIAGSRFERHNIKSKDFQLFHHNCRPTDDSVMSLAVAAALMSCQKDRSDLEEQAVHWMQEMGQKYPWAGYGGRFYRWLWAKRPEPYYSFGNGSAMRVSACGFAVDCDHMTLEDSIQLASELSWKVTKVTHNHPEGLKGAEATAVAIVLARKGKTIPEIKAYINDHYYLMDFTLDGIRESYSFDVTCQGSVPQALMAFLESTSFEDAIRNAISIGGDSDTIAAIAGGIAEAYYGIPDELRQEAVTYLDSSLREILDCFEREVQNGERKLNW